MSCLSHARRYASYGSWKATSALAKRKYRLSSSGGIPRQEDLNSQRARARVRHAIEIEAIMRLLHLESFKFAMHTAAGRKAAFFHLEE